MFLERIARRGHAQPSYRRTCQRRPGARAMSLWQSIFLRPRLVDRAVALFRIEELADAAEVNIGLSPHRVFLVVPRHGVLLLRLAKAEPEVFRQALEIALGQGNDRIGTAIARAFAAIVGL